MLKITMKTKFRALPCALYLGLLLVPALSGCGSDPIPDYTRQQPKRSDIVGLWVLTPESAQDMKVLGQYKSNNTTIQLKSDGTFHVVNLPDCAYSRSIGGWELNKGKLLTTNGHWSIRELNFNPFLDNNIKQIKVWDVYLQLGKKKSETNWITPYPVLMHQNPPYVIHIPFGDSDFSEKIDFVKKLN